MNTFNSTFRRMAETIFQPRPKEEVWEWADRNVKIPEIVGSLNPGQLNTGRLRFWRLVWQLYWRKRTRFITIQGSARVGKTFFALVCVLHKIATWSGPIGWLDATRFTARRFARSEFQPHVDDCEPANRLAIKDRTHWTLSEMFFEGSKLNMLGAGSPSDTTGFQAELVVINESNKCKHDVKSEAGIHDIMIGRSKHFWRTRKIIEVSTPTDNYGRITTRWKDGTQHAAYFPCPTCNKPQRMTFFPEEKEVPWDDSTEFDAYGFPLGEPVTSVEKTMSVGFAHCRRPEDEKQYDTEKVEREASYLCGYCEALSPAHKLNWMMRRVTLRAHNIKAPDDHISFHAWTGMSPFEHIGTLANKFLAARGNIGKMHSFWNDELGLPFVRHAASVSETDIDVVIKRSPQYMLRTLPRKPVLLTMNADVQQVLNWWSINAWGLIEEHPDVPIWNAMIDYGSVVSWDQLEEIAGITPDKDGKYNEYIWPETGERFRVHAGLIDSGFQAQSEKRVYDFCIRNANVFSPSKGGGWQHMRGMTVRTSPVADEKLDLFWYSDSTFKQELLYGCIKEGKGHYWLPYDVGRDFREQMSSEHTEERKQPDGTMKLEWVVSGAAGNHLSDTQKMNLALGTIIEPKLLEMREEILAARK